MEVVAPSSLRRRSTEAHRAELEMPPGADDHEHGHVRSGASMRRLRLPPAEQSEAPASSARLPRDGSKGADSLKGNKLSPTKSQKTLTPGAAPLTPAGKREHGGGGPGGGVGTALGIPWMDAIDPSHLVTVERRVTRDGEVSSEEEGGDESRFDDAVHAPRGALEAEEEEEDDDDDDGEPVRVPRVLDRPLPLRQPFSRVRKIFPGESLPPVLGGGARIEDDEVIKMWYQRGKEHMRRCKFAAAALAFSKGLWQDPWCRPLRIERLKCHMCLNSYEQAQTDAELLLREDRSFVPGLLFLAESFFAQGKYEFARLHVSTGYRLDPGSPTFRTFAEQIDAIFKFRTEGDKSRPEVSYSISRGMLARRLLDPVGMAYGSQRRGGRATSGSLAKLFYVEYFPSPRPAPAGPRGRRPASPPPQPGSPGGSGPEGEGRPPGTPSTLGGAVTPSRPR